jgi:hypothetical protein
MGMAIIPCRSSIAPLVLAMKAVAVCALAPRASREQHRYISVLNSGHASAPLRWTRCRDTRERCRAHGVGHYDCHGPDLHAACEDAKRRRKIAQPTDTLEPFIRRTATSASLPAASPGPSASGCLEGPATIGQGEDVRSRLPLEVLPERRPRPQHKKCRTNPINSFIFNKSVRKANPFGAIESPPAASTVRQINPSTALFESQSQLTPPHKINNIAPKPVQSFGPSC